MANLINTDVTLRILTPADAGRIGVRQGDAVKVESRRGQIKAKTMVTERVGEGERAQDSVP